MKIASLVSGGVDSSVTIPLLKSQGFDPTVFYIKIGMEDEEGFIDCSFKEDIEYVIQICKKYDCKLEVVSLHEEYWDKVISYTIETVKKGLTPNPDMMCNKLIKFGTFEDRYGKDFDKITTGHYASITEKNGETFLTTAKDKFKDQTYFLGQLNYQQVSKLMFPIHDMLKGDVREYARKEKLPSAERPDSQGICFLGKINYRDFIKRFVGEKTGPILEKNTGKKLGEHKGFWFHTIGQRHGLGLAQGPWFVVDKNTEENIIYVAKGYDPEEQYDDIIKLKDFHFINPSTKLENLDKITFKIRHTPEFASGKLVKKDDLMIIESDQKIAGIAPGQFGVVYDESMTYCLGSGVID